MRLRTDEPEIVKDDPFKNDRLERRRYAPALTSLFEKVEGPSVLCLSSPWGTGKTTFIKMFREHLFGHGIPSVYFNAWETDYNDNPLITLIGELSTGIDELKNHGYDVTRAKRALLKVQKTGKNLLKKRIPVTLKLAAHGSPDLDKGMDHTLSDFSSGVLENQIRNYTSSRDQTGKFREHMKELVAELHGEEPGNSARPLVIFIDELDCCRPEYAVQLLEKVRHFFNVEGVITVIGADMEQLGSSMKTIFGQNLKEKGFLRKFIDLEYSLLPETSAMENYCRYLSNETAAAALLKEKSENDDLIRELEYSVILSAASFSLSLRDLNVLFSSLALLFPLFDELTYDTVTVSVILCTLKMRNAKLYSQVLNRERSVFHLINELNKVKKAPPSLKEYDRFYMERRLAMLSLKSISDDEFQHQLRPGGGINGTELNMVYKMIKDSNDSPDALIFTDTLLDNLRYLGPIDQ